MSRKKPIDSLERFYNQFDSEIDIADIIAFNSKQLKKLLKDGYYIETMSEFWYDSEDGGLDFNNWVEEYAEGIWWMSQKDVDRATKDAVRKFSHLTRRTCQKGIPRAYETTRGEFKMIYLYARDRIDCDYAIFLRKRGTNNDV